MEKGHSWWPIVIIQPGKWYGTLDNRTDEELANSGLTRILAVAPYQALMENMDGWLHDISDTRETRGDQAGKPGSLLLEKSPPIQTTSEEGTYTWISLQEP